MNFQSNRGCDQVAVRGVTRAYDREPGANRQNGVTHPAELPISETRMEQILQYLTSGIKAD
jgi:hypothetical protein